MTRRYSASNCQNSPGVFQLIQLHAVALSLQLGPIRVLGEVRDLISESALLKVFQPSAVFLCGVVILSGQILLVLSL